MLKRNRSLRLLLLLLALSAGGTSSQAHAQGRASQGAIWETKAAALSAAGKIHEAGDAYMEAGKAYTAEGSDDAAAKAYDKAATLYEKEADEILKQLDKPKSAAPAPAPPKPPAPVPHAAPPAPPTPQAAPPAPAPAAPLTLAQLKLKPKPHLIIGHAIFEDGRPVPDFVVNAAGFNGKFNATLNVANSATSSGQAKGSNGYYEMQVASSHLDTDEDATIVSVRAKTTLHYNGTVYGLELYPLDGTPNGTGPDDFRGQMKRGVVRNFVLKLSGLQPGYSAAKYPDHGVDLVGSQSEGAYYGGSLIIDCRRGSESSDIVGSHSVSHTFPKGSQVTLTLTPTGPLFDGSKGQLLTRSSEVGGELYFYGIPYGLYTATAQLTRPDGSTLPLRWKKRSTDSSEPFLSAMPVQWQLSVNDFNDTGELISAPQLYLFP